MKSSDIKISVVIPTCDRLNYLIETIESVLNQTFPAFEIIIVDNGRKLIDIRDLPRQDNIRLIRALPRFGVSQARNCGAILSKGNYVSFLDDDDKWSNEYLASVAKVIEKERSDVILGRLVEMHSNTPIKGKQANFKSRADLIKKILKRNPGAVGSNTTVRKSEFFNTSGYDPYITTNQDKALVLDLLMNSAKVNRANDAYVLFRTDGEGPRQTDLYKRIEGKIRFTKKYWKAMSITTRIFNLIQIVRLWMWKNFKKK